MYTFAIYTSRLYRWNCEFRVSYRLILREKELHMNVCVYNPSKEIPFNFNLLLHTYFKCPDVRRYLYTLIIFLIRLYF